DGVGGLGVLADGAHPQAPAGAEQGDGQPRDDDPHQVDEDVLLEQRRTDQRDVGQQRDPQRGEAHRSVEEPGVVAHHGAKKNEVTPIASTLSTTPTMICWTWYPTANMASSASMNIATIGAAS